MSRFQGILLEKRRGAAEGTSWGLSWGIWDWQKENEWCSRGGPCLCRSHPSVVVPTAAETCKI